jgi:hypothetical protein
MTTDSTSPASGEDGSSSGALEAERSQELEQGHDSASNGTPSQNRQSKDTAANNRAAVAVACIVRISQLNNSLVPES